MFKDDGITGSLKNKVSVLLARLRAKDCRSGSVLSSTKFRTCCPSTARMGLLLKKSRSVVKNCVRNRKVEFLSLKYSEDFKVVIRDGGRVRLT